MATGRRCVAHGVSMPNGWRPSSARGPWSTANSPPAPTSWWSPPRPVATRPMPSGCSTSGAAVVLEKPLCTHPRRGRPARRWPPMPTVTGCSTPRTSPTPRWSRSFVRRTRSLGPLRHLEVRALQACRRGAASRAEEWGGGALFDLGVHPLAVALLAVGQRERSARFAPSSAGGRRARLRRTRRGVARVRERAHSVQRGPSWQAGPEPLWDAQAASGHRGRAGRDLPGAVARTQRGTGRTPAPPAPTVAILDQAGYLGQLAAFADDLDSGRPPMMDARFGRRVLELVAGGVRRPPDGGGETVELPFNGPRDHTPLELWRNSPR